MINFNFSLNNFFSSKDTGQVDYVEFDKRVSKNKSLEFQVSYWGTFDTIFEFGFRYNRIRQDHAGLYIHLTVFGFGFIFNFYDNRHWNFAADDWEIYPTEN